MATSHSAQAYTKKVLTAGKKAIERAPLLEAYAREFLYRAPDGFMGEISPKDCMSIIEGHYEFIDKRKKQRIVRVYNPSEKAHGWENERTVVELNTNDSPFILDSVTAMIIEQGYHIYETLHPIFTLKRDKNQKIVKIAAPDAEPADGLHRESAMHFQISYISAASERKALEQAIDNALHFVNMAVQDWRLTLAKAETIIASLTKQTVPFDVDVVHEVQDFLRWAIDDNFIFLGYREYDFVDEKGKHKLVHKEDADLGIFRADEHEAKPRGLVSLPDKEVFNNPDVLLEITKSGRKSVVHRPVHMDYIGVKRYDDDGNLIGESRMLGLFTSAVYYQSARLIPIIRRKIDSVVERSGYSPNSHNGKALVAVLETYPRDELLQISEDDLFAIAMGIVALSERPATRAFTRFDRFDRFVTTLIFTPRERYSTHVREKIEEELEAFYGGTVQDYYLTVTESSLARILFLVELDGKKKPPRDIAPLEERLQEICANWDNGLHETLVHKLGERKGEALYAKYVNAFPESFKARYHFGGTLIDIQKMEEAYKNADITLDLDLYHLEKDDDDHYQLKIYHPETLVTLSEVMPVIENMGFHAIDELTFFVKPSGEKGLWVHHFRLEVDHEEGVETSAAQPDYDHIKQQFEQALFDVWARRVEDDELNNLIVKASLNVRDVVLLRAYSKFFVQTSFPYSFSAIATSLSRHPALAVQLIALFYARFDPSFSPKAKRTEKIAEIEANIRKALQAVTSVTDDRIIRQFLDSMGATLRTNFFQTVDGAHKDYISLKFNSSKVPNLPAPRPHVEVFVHSRDVEGIHLRGGKVARGGLRWSDRPEDFRTEVLGLVKAQMVKNAVIVPVGSKGGFVVKHPKSGSREEAFEHGRECYKTFLRGLLDITDNYVKGKVVPPEQVVRHDDDDPYLVVAADKGTATFSDTANAISEEYNFWLKDAFASGGSNGYDHKKMGITARGAWVSVHRHFMERGLDTQKDDFSVIGIGDMGGDVFGNGMLLSKHIKLVGAFNHLHIFLDPDPNPATSYKERERLFNLPRSSWEDYDAELISKGGGVFLRSAKSIKLSAQVKKMLGVNDAALAPEALINAMLKANVDLLWNGGIGTYVKSENESHEAAGDRANDALRVNGNEVNATVVGEGGNLGFTQLGRIEYARRGNGGEGGRINTDAIDNSAGVDCSDHEVNIKIALNSVVESGSLSWKKRNNFLEEMTDEVADLVLRDNYLQTLSITLAEQKGCQITEQEMRLMHHLEEIGLLDRKIEFLPDDEELKRRQQAGEGLTRPELSVLLAYSKLAIYDELISSNMPDGDYFDNELTRYFPQPMQKKYGKEIDSHQLRREIITTAVSNSIANRMNGTFFFRMKENTGVKGCDVARSYIAARDVFGLRDIWNAIEDAEKSLSVAAKTSLYDFVSDLVERVNVWFLDNRPQPLDVSALVKEFKPGVAKIEECLDAIMADEQRDRRDAQVKELTDQGVSKPLALRLSNLVPLSSACDIIDVSNDSKLPIKIVGEVYFALGKRFKLSWLREVARDLMSQSHWENLALQTLIERLFTCQRQIAAAITQDDCKSGTCGGALEMWEERNAKEIERYDDFIEDITKLEEVDIATLTVALQRVTRLVG